MWLLAIPEPMSVLKAFLETDLLSTQTTSEVEGTSVMDWQKSARIVEASGERLKDGPATAICQDLNDLDPVYLAAPSIKESLRTAARVPEKPVLTAARRLKSGVMMVVVSVAK